MNITQRNERGVLVLSLSGTFGTGAGESQLDAALSEKADRIVVNLSGVKLLESSCVGLLVAANESIRDTGRRLALARVPEKIKVKLRMTHLLGRFEVYESVEAAINAMQ